MYVGSTQLEESLSVDMWRSSNTDEPCYTITILDGQTEKNGLYAVFIVPQGIHIVQIISVKHFSSFESINIFLQH